MPFYNYQFCSSLAILKVMTKCVPGLDPIAYTLNGYAGLAIVHPMMPTILVSYTLTLVNKMQSMPTPTKIRSRWRICLFSISRTHGGTFLLAAAKEVYMELFQVKSYTFSNKVYISTSKRVC
jgi:hypothetical protein